MTAGASSLTATAAMRDHPRVTRRGATIAPRVATRAEMRLARRLRGGDERALNAVYADVGPATFGYLLRTLGDRGTAEDVQQQVFTEVWRRAGEYDPQRASLVTWVLMIARSRAIDQLRKRVPVPRDPQSGDLGAEVADGGEDADELLERWRMAHHLMRLPADERVLLQMRFYQELSQSEIAERTGVPLGTVKSRMVSGLRRLRELVEAEAEPAT